MSCIRVSLIAVLRLSVKNEAIKISRSEAKNLTGTQRRTEIYLKRDGSLTSVKRSKLSGSDSKWVTIHSCEAVKGVRVDNGFQGKSTIRNASAKKHSPVRIWSYSNSRKPGRLEMRTDSVIRKIVSMVKQRKYIYNISISIDRWFECFVRKWIDCKSVTGW
jgi:hypothetical protein